MESVTDALQSLSLQRAEEEEGRRRRKRRGAAAATKEAAAAAAEAAAREQPLGIALGGHGGVLTAFQLIAERARHDRRAAAAAKCEETVHESLAAAGVHCIHGAGAAHPSALFRSPRGANADYGGRGGGRGGGAEGGRGGGKGGGKRRWRQGRRWQGRRWRQGRARQGRRWRRRGGAELLVDVEELTTSLAQLSDPCDSLSPTAAATLPWRAAMLRPESRRRLLLSARRRRASSRAPARCCFRCCASRPLARGLEQAIPLISASSAEYLREWMRPQLAAVAESQWSGGGGGGGRGGKGKGKGGGGKGGKGAGRTRRRLPRRRRRL